MNNKRSILNDIKLAFKDFNNVIKKNVKSEGKTSSNKKNIKFNKTINTQRVLIDNQKLSTKIPKKTKVINLKNGSGNITVKTQLRDKAMKYFEKNPVIALLQSQIQFEDQLNGTNLYKEFNKMLKEKNITTSPPYYLELKYIWEDYINEKGLKPNNLSDQQLVSKLNDAKNAQQTAEQQRDQAQQAQQTAEQQRDQAQQELQNSEQEAKRIQDELNIASQGWNASKIAQLNTEQQINQAKQETQRIQGELNIANQEKESIAKNLDQANNNIKELKLEKAVVYNNIQQINKETIEVKNILDENINDLNTFVKGFKSNSSDTQVTIPVAQEDGVPVVQEQNQQLNKNNEMLDLKEKQDSNNNLSINIDQTFIPNVAAEGLVNDNTVYQINLKYLKEQLNKSSGKIYYNTLKHLYESLNYSLGIKQKNTEAEKGWNKAKEKISELQEKLDKINEEKIKKSEEKRKRKEQRKKIQNEINNRLKENNFNNVESFYDKKQSKWYYYNNSNKDTKWISPIKQKLINLIMDYHTTAAESIKAQKQYKEIDNEDDYKEIIKGINKYEDLIQEKKNKENREKLAREKDERERKAKERDKQIRDEKKKKADQQKEIEMLKDELQKLVDKQTFSKVVRLVNTTREIVNKKNILNKEIKNAKEEASRKQNFEIDRLLNKYEKILNELKKHNKNIQPKKNIDKIKKDINVLKNHEDKIKELNKKIKNGEDFIEKYKKAEKERNDAEKELQRQKKIQQENLKIVKKEFEDVVNNFLGVKEYGPTKITINSKTSDYEKVARERIKKYQENQLKFIINNDKNIINEIELINKDSIKIRKPEYGKKLKEWYEITKRLIKERQQELKTQQELEKARKNLPKGWDAAFDKRTNKIYFFNRGTNQTSWKKPVAKVQSRGSPVSSPRGSGIICQRGGKSITQAIKDFANTPFRINRGFKADTIKDVQRFFKNNLVSYVNKTNLEKLECNKKNKRWELKNIIVYISRVQMNKLDYNGAGKRKGNLSKTSGFENAFKELIKHISVESGKKIGFTEFGNYLQKELGIGSTKDVRYLYQEGNIEINSESDLISENSNLISEYSNSSESSNLVSDTSSDTNTQRLSTDSIHIQKGGKKKSYKKKKNGPCWVGYHKVKGKKDYTKGSCVKIEKKLKGNDKINKMKYKLYQKLVSKNLV